MKNLKIRLGLFSLLAILAISVFLTSCEQEELIEDTIVQSVDEIALEVDIPAFFFPHGFEDKMSKTELDSYINTLNAEGFEKLALHRKVVYYFAALDKVALLANNASYGDIFNENTVADFLSEREFLAFQTFDTESIVTLRDCTNWVYRGIHRVSDIMSFPPYLSFCIKYHRYTRQCPRWWWPSSTYTDTRLDFIGPC